MKKVLIGRLKRRNKMNIELEKFRDELIENESSKYNWKSDAGAIAGAQAERTLKEGFNAAIELVEKRPELLENINPLIEALEFYANRETYKINFINDELKGVSLGDLLKQKWALIVDDSGRIARESLKNMKNK